ncbi:MAG: hypothetical protein GXP30_02705, partial [Verrucomicrobia bacterium]|nr:hypothetical protein [Verrucomicrobiota bacterium]
ITVKDRDKRIVFESGDLDPNGDVRDLHSTFVHHHAKKIGDALTKTDWKSAAGLERQKDDLKWLRDKYLFSLQSKFLTRNHRGGEREQILPINFSIDPLPYVRPDTRPGILIARPTAARKQARGIPPLGSRWAKYKIGKDQLTGKGPYTVNIKFVCQMVPVNLIKAISVVPFDYNLSAREISKRIVHGHKTSSSKQDKDRKGGRLIIWDKTLTLQQAPFETNFKPSESDIMAVPSTPFPYKDPASFGGIGGIEEGITIPPVTLPKGAGAPKGKSIIPKASGSEEDDSFE